MIKIFKMNESDWVAGEDIENCKKFLSKLVDIPEDEVIDEPYELSKEEIEKLIFIEDINDKNSVKRTFKEELELLIKKGEEFPCFFATKEW